MLQKVNNCIKNILFKGGFYRCVICQTKSDNPSDLCHDCLLLFKPLESACLLCALPFSLQPANTLCGNCIKSPPTFNRVMALWRYEGIVPHFVGQLKYHQKLIHAKIIGSLLQAALLKTVEHKPLPELIIPVPLHPNRLKTRGFNQALEIAKPIARALSIPLMVKGCERIRDTPEQSQLPLSQRARNLKNAFLITRPIKEKHIAIVDDVVTTTHTVNALATALKAAGAHHIEIWCAARTPKEA